MELPFDEEIVVVGDAPQQDAGSVDCGAVVLYVIFKYMSHQTVDKSVADHEMKTMHANISNTLIMWGRGDENGVRTDVALNNAAGPSGH